MKNMKKIVSVLLTLAMLATMASVVLANSIPSPASPSTVLSHDTEGKFKTGVGTILGFIQYIGYAVAVGMLLYIGIKYMMASANEKADLKKGAVNYVIGAIVVAGASTIAGFLVNILGSNNNAVENP